MMLTAKEQQFFDYWSQQRQRKKQFLRKLSIGLPLSAFIAAAVFINLLAGWYKKADMDLHTHSSVIIVVLVALLGTVVFITIFSAYHRWDHNEAYYHDLLRKQESTQKNKV